MNYDPELHDPELSNRLRKLDDSLVPPDAWVRQALSVPARYRPEPQPQTPESAWRPFVPHVLGMALLLGIGVAAYFNGGLFTAAAPALPRVDAPGGPVDLRFLLIGVPAVAALGFSFRESLRRMVA